MKNVFNAARSIQNIYLFDFNKSVKKNPEKAKEVFNQL